MYKLTGTVKVVNNTVQVSEKFSKREFVVTDSTGMYPQDISFQATQDKCSLLDGVQPGEQIEVSFNLRGREWTSPQGEVKYFNTLEAWRIEKAGANSGMAANSGMGSMSNDPIPASTPSPIEAASSDEDDDLPF
jgi:hypothetical protein